MNAPPFPLNPSVGESHGNWTWNGVRWVCAPTTGIQVLCTVFASSGPYMPSPGLVSLVVETIAAGGAGGGVANPQGVLSFVMSGGGGGSGSYSRKTLPAALVLGGVQVTIGDGGLGSPNGVGGVGGATTFGALCTANGGSGGRNCDAVTGAGGGGNLGLAGTGDVAFPGAAGMNGNFLDLASGSWFTLSGALGGWIYGGNSTAGEIPSSAGANGEAGWGGTGAGGQGAVMNQLAAGSFAGGAGASGLCIVTEYCWASASDGGDCMNPPINVNARVALTHVPWTGPGPCPPGWTGQVTYEGDD